MSVLYVDGSWTALTSVVPTVQFNGESYSVPALYLKGAYRRAVVERQADVRQFASVWVNSLLVKVPTEPSTMVPVLWCQTASALGASLAPTPTATGNEYIDWYDGARDWGAGCWLDTLFWQQIEDLAVEWFLQDLWVEALLTLAVAFNQRVRIILKWANQIFRTAFAGRENARRLEFDGDFHKTLHTLDGSVAPVVLAACA